MAVISEINLKWDDTKQQLVKDPVGDGYDTVQVDPIVDNPYILGTEYLVTPSDLIEYQLNPESTVNPYRFYGSLVDGTIKDRNKIIISTIGRALGGSNTSTANAWFQNTGINPQSEINFTKFENKKSLLN